MRPEDCAQVAGQYGSLAGVVANAEKITGVVGQNLRDHLDFLPLGKKLVTVVCDLPDLPAPAALTVSAPDLPTLRELYSRYNFRTWLREVTAALEGATARNPPFPLLPQPANSQLPTATAHQPSPHRRSITRPCSTGRARDLAGAHRSRRADCARQRNRRPRPVRRPHRRPLVRGRARPRLLSPVAHTAPGTPEQLPREAVLARLKPWLEAVDRKKLLQNAKFDQHIFANHGITLAGIADDTLLQSYVLDSGKWAGGGHDLGQLCKRHLGLDTIAFEDLCGKGAKQISFDQVELERAATYAAEDADMTLRIHQRLRPAIAEAAGLERIYHEIELPARR